MSLLRQAINVNKTFRISSFNVCNKFLSTKTDDPIQSHIDKLVKSNKIVVFMKGVPQAPRCGFSNAVVDILSIHKAKFEAHDVLQDENLRNGKLILINRFVTSLVYNTLSYFPKKKTLFSFSLSEMHRHLL